MLTELKGSIPALITPLKYDELRRELVLDKSKLINLVDDLTPYSDAILLAGTTGQGPMFKPKEKVSLAYLVKEVSDLPIIIGISQNNLNKARGEIKSIEEELGPTTFLVSTGFYNKPGPLGVLEFYLALEKQTKGNIIVYNVPGRTNINISIETSVELSKHPKIIGEKEASGNLDQIRAKIDGVEESYSIVAGDDTIIAEVLSMGGRGVISATANYAPGISKRIVDEGLSRYMSEAFRLQTGLFTPAAEAVFAEGGQARNPVQLAYMFNTEVALPLSLKDLSQDQKDKIDETLKRFEGMEGFLDMNKYKT